MLSSVAVQPDFVFYPEALSPGLQNDAKVNAIMRYPPVSLQFPLEVLDEIVEELAADPSRTRKDVERDLSSCARTGRRLRGSTRRVRFRNLTLDLVNFTPKSMLEWADHAKVVVPHLRCLTVDWIGADTMERGDVVSLLEALQAAVLQELNLKGPFLRLPDVLYGIAGQDSLRCITFQHVRNIPSDLILRRKGLRNLHLKQAHADVPASVPFSENMCIEFDTRADSFELQGFRRPRALHLGLKGDQPLENLVVQALCKQLTELTLDFSSESGYEHLSNLPSNMFESLTKLSLVFQRGGDLATPFDVPLWMQMTGATNVVDLSIVFIYDCADTVEDIGDVLDGLALQPLPLSNIFDMFAKSNLPKLERGKISLKFSLLAWNDYQPHELAAVQDEIGEFARQLFRGHGDVMIEGLLEEGEDTLLYLCFDQDD
ncbi:hypothetical protein CVT26_001420 [Gymnopilus dilepis]|uniref:F-box domain-containing protein n=1 Tax=Gymnopilus dilepis TaxID=231916 RepID=A0A409W7B5_9AGAR|nr:hypothetical protein CVT26_001420 [Gymnopilus dilepis]